MAEIAYHFVGKTLRDGRPVPPDGEWLEHDGPLVMCESGLHASLRPWHALQYAPGSVLCRVEIDGVAGRQGDKVVCARRRIMARVDLAETLRQFARDEALRVIHLWNPPKVVRRYLQTGDESLRTAASDAAGSDAWASGDAGRAAARAAVWAADAASVAAWDAAWDASRAASGAASDASGERFDQLAMAALDQAAREASER